MVNLQFVCNGELIVKKRLKVFIFVDDCGVPSTHIHDACEPDCLTTCDKLV